MPARPGPLHAQDPLHLSQLGVGILQQGRPPDEHVDPDPVADGHLVDETAEVPLELGHACAQLVAPSLEVDRVLGLTAARRQRPGRARRLVVGGGGLGGRPWDLLKGMRIRMSGQGPKKCPVNLPP